MKVVFKGKAVYPPGIIVALERLAQLVHAILDFDFFKVQHG